jgi:hypothetical protein
MAPVEKPHEWRLVNETLGLPLLEGGHSGSNQADLLIRVIDRYNIGSKVFLLLLLYHHVYTAYTILQLQIGWFTADNATNNDTGLRHLENFLAPQAPDNKPWQWKERRTRFILFSHTSSLVANVA